MSHWADYITETGTSRFIESEWGFIGYRLVEGVLHVEDFYIIPEKRRTGIPAQLLVQVEDIAREEGKSAITTCVRMTNKNRDGIIRLHFRLGFETWLADNGELYFRKLIKGEE